MGGICGNANTSTQINNCYNTGNISAFSSSTSHSEDSSSSYATAGGISGTSHFSIQNCYNIGNISAQSTSSSPTTSSYPSSASDASAGGISGYFNQINYCYNMGSVSASSQSLSFSPSNSINIGGIAGTSGYSKPVSNSYCINLYGSLYGEQLTSTQMKDAANCIGFDFNNTWSISPDINNGYPYLKNLSLVKSNDYGVTKYYSQTTDKLKKAAQECDKKAIAYINTVTKQAKKGSKNTEQKSSNITSGLASSLAAEMTISKTQLVFLDIDIPDDAKNYCYQALLDMFVESKTIKNEIKLGNAGDPFSVVKAIEKAVWTMELPKRKYGNYEISISIPWGIFDSFNGTIICVDKNATKKPFEKSYTVSINSSLDSINQTIANYIDAMNGLATDAVEEALREVYQELSTILTGYSGLGSWVSAKLTPQINNAMISYGLGDVNRALGTCANLYNYYASFKSSDSILDLPTRAQNLIGNADAIIFSDNTITNEAVRKALSELNKAKEKLVSAAQEYLQDPSSIAPQEPSLWDKLAFKLKTIFQCPVDIIVYNETGDEVGYVVDDEVYYDEGSVDIITIL